MQDKLVTCCKRDPSNTEGPRKINVEMRALRWLLGRKLNWSFKEQVERIKMKISIRGFKSEYKLKSSRHWRATAPHLLFWFGLVSFLSRRQEICLRVKEKCKALSQPNIRRNILCDRNNIGGHTPVGYATVIS